MTNVKHTPTFGLEIPEVQSSDESSNINPSTSINDNGTKSVEEFALKATLDKQDSLIDNFIMYEVEGFGLNLSPNSTLCPTNNCEFELDDGKLSSVLAGQYLFNGVLKVGIEEEEGTRSSVMNIGSSLNVRETLENDDTTTEFLTGKFNLGEANTALFSPDIGYRVANGSLTIEDDEATLILQGGRTE
ncbi:MAG: hypothetical protein L0H53_08515 [Candidatus Nitrosocosmicus sp.]|nr:hypothetical protein [Candidatus Nitrosocosmicus sp.]MDN5867661.1 hypothetical protein [Candidatus Nitrosocosmicus sp.]